MNHSHIPVPKISSTIKLHDRLPPRRESLEKSSSGKAISVAAQRAAFEKLDANAASQKLRNNLNLSNVELRHSEGRSSPARKFEFCPKANSPLSPKLNNSRLNGPCSPTLNRSNSFLENKWKNKFEDSEKRRKLLLQKSESGKKRFFSFE